MEKTNSEQMEHSPIGASSYYRWKACPGSVRLSKGIKSPESPYAKEGTTAHDIASGVLEDFFFRKGKPAVPPNMPADMMPAVKDYVEIIKREVRHAGSQIDQDHVLIEHRFDLTSVHKGLFGTADCVIYSPNEMKLIVVDYKHGAGIPVEVEDNVQLKYYALGALLSTNFPCKTVEIKIVQPRCDHKDGIERTWAFDTMDIIDFMADLADDAAATEKEDALISPGSHCRFCPAAPTACPEISKKSLAVAKQEFSPALSYDPAKLKDTLDQLPMLETFIKSVREFAYGEAMHGRGAEGYKLVEKRASRKWSESEMIVHRDLNKFFGLSKKDIYTSKMLSPAQIEKLIPKEKRNELQSMVVKQSSGLKLVPSSSPGTPAKVDPASQFQKLEGS